MCSGCQRVEICSFLVITHHNSWHIAAETGHWDVECVSLSRHSPGQLGGEHVTAFLHS